MLPQVPFLEGYDKRKPIIIHGDELSEAVADFPLPIATDDAVLIEGLEDDGDDLRFTMADGTTVLPHEIEVLTLGPNRLSAWVKIPTIGLMPQTIYAYYGDTTASNVEAPTVVWGAYEGVWHMADPLVAAGARLRDSSPNGNDSLTPAEAPTVINGPIGGAYRFDGTQSVSIPHDATLDLGTESFMLSAWVRTATATTPNDYAVSHGSTGVPGYGLRVGTTEWRVRLNDGSNDVSTDFGDYAQLMGSWHQLTALIDRGKSPKVTVYVDGALVDDQTTLSGFGSIERDTDLRLSHGVNPYTGDLDELRLTKQLPTPGWIRATYETFSDQGRFVTIGDEQTRP
jgi:hypothetical protein